MFILFSFIQFVRPFNRQNCWKKDILMKNEWFDLACNNSDQEIRILMSFYFLSKKYFNVKYIILTLYYFKISIENVTFFNVPVIVVFNVEKHLK